MLCIVTHAISLLVVMRWLLEQFYTGVALVEGSIPRHAGVWFLHALQGDCIFRQDCC